jgi:hypothetical protein
VRLKGLGKLKKLMTLSSIEPATFRLVTYETNGNICQCTASILELSPHRSKQTENRTKFTIGKLNLLYNITLKSSLWLMVAIGTQVCVQISNLLDMGQTA